MGLFDKRERKRRDDFDSPIEQVDLDGDAPRAAASVGADSAPARLAVADAPAPANDVADDYGIEQAIDLMRTLPSDNVELVVKVVKFSLESVGIKLPVIIEDATRRQRDIQDKINLRRGEIAELELEISTRKQEIERLEADYRETTTVRERLELAEGISHKKKG